MLTSSLEVGVNPFRCERFINVMDRGESRTFTRMNVPLSYIRPHERTPLFKFLRKPRVARPDIIEHRTSIGKLNALIDPRSPLFLNLTSQDPLVAVHGRIVHRLNTYLLRPTSSSTTTRRERSLPITIDLIIECIPSKMSRFYTQFLECNKRVFIKMYNPRIMDAKHKISDLSDILERYTGQVR